MPWQDSNCHTAARSARLLSASRILETEHQPGSCILRCASTRLPEQCRSTLTCLVAVLFPNKAVVFRPVCMMPAADMQMFTLLLAVSTLQVQLATNISLFDTVSPNSGNHKHDAGKPFVRTMRRADRPAAVGSCMLFLHLCSRTLSLAHSSQPQHISTGQPPGPIKAAQAPAEHLEAVAVGSAMSQAMRQGSSAATACSWSSPLLLKASYVVNRRSSARTPRTQTQTAILR